MKLKKVLIFLLFFFTSFINVFASGGLKNILIDDVKLENFNSETTSYDLNYDSKKESVKVTFEYDNSLYKGKGNYGDIKLNYGDNKLTFTLTSLEDSSDTITYTLNIKREDKRSSENSLTILITDKLEYEVNVDNSLKVAEIKAVLKDQTSSFVSGYGERIGSNAVTLRDEKTIVEVKVQAENQSIKTYVINIIKENYKNNDATLKSLKIDEIKFNFKPSVFEYNLNVPNEVTNLKITAISSDENAEVSYKQNEALNLGSNNIVIKVVAEDGITTKEYKLNITRLEKEALVKDIKIEGVDFVFDKDVFNYEIETDLDTIDFNITLNNEDAHYEIVDNENLKNNSVIKINIEDDKESVTYNFKIKKEEIIEEVEEEDVNLGERDSDNKKDKNEFSEFFRKNEMIIALSIFGVGLLSLLIAILTKYKGSQIM